MAIKSVVSYLMQDPENGIAWLRKEPEMTLPVVIIISKVDMDTQVPDAINTCEYVTYIDASYATFLRSRIYSGSFIITLFGAAVYY